MSARLLAVAALALTALSVPVSAASAAPWPPAGCDIIQHCVCTRVNNVYEDVTGYYVLACD